MDNFREWLSDNLRYFMLGGAILLIVVVLFFGVRAFMGSGKGDSSKDTVENQTTADNDQGNVPSSPANDGETDEKKDASPATDTNAETTMEKASTEVTELIQSYYKAFGEKDIATLKTIEDGFTPADESQINSRDYIDGYEVQDVYAKKGLTDDSYVVYVVFNYICTGIETPVPALSQFYVETDSDGSLKIKGGADEDADISAYVKKLESGKDVQDLITKVKADYEAAQASDSALAEFLQGLGDDASASADAGTVLTVTEDCNVRASADSEGEVIGGLSAGTEVEKKGQEGDWIQVDYDGQTGYIYSGLLE